MKRKFTPNKEFEEWIANPFMLNKDNDPGSAGEYTHPYTKGAWECYKKFIVEPDETRVVTQEEHQDGSVQMIVNFLQRMKSSYGLVLRCDPNDKLIVICSNTGTWWHLNELQDAGLI